MVPDQVDAEDPVTVLRVDPAEDTALNLLLDLVGNVIVIVNLVTVSQAQVERQGLVVKEEFQETS